MRDFPGAPGTYLFLLLKCSQLLLSVFLLFCLLVMPMPAQYYYFHGYRLGLPSRFITDLCWLLAVEMLLIEVTCVVALGLAKTAAVRYEDARLLAVMDWVVATLSLPVASVLVSTSMDFPDELVCVGGVKCRTLHLLFVPALISWLANALSHLITLWVLASDLCGTPSFAVAASALAAMSVHLYI